MNQDGFLEFHEFELLNRHIVPDLYEEKKCKGIFVQFSETFTGENEETVQALSFENFSHLNRKFSIFTTERLGKFVRIGGENIYVSKDSMYIEDLKEQSKNIPYILQEMKWRYFQANRLENRDEMLEILELVKQQVKQLKKPQAVLIALRLMDEESKRACVLTNITTLLPGIALSF